MKRFFLFSLLLVAMSCSHNSSQTWEDVKTAGRYMQRGVNSLMGKDYESRMLASEDDFYGPFDEEFIPLSQSDLQKGDIAFAQAKKSPGQSGIPSLESFYAPASALGSLFAKIHFDTDQHSIKERQEIEALIRLAKYIKNHPHLYLAVYGHCDERASASYNLALGMRRANSVRAFLIKHGADPNRIYTVSRGKEQPIALGHSQADWKINRRSEFKVYEK